MKSRGTPEAQTLKWITYYSNRRSHAWIPGVYGSTAGPLDVPGASLSNSWHNYVGTEVNMVASQTISRRGEMPAISGLMAYLLNFDGSDVLEFKDNNEAREAADTLRARDPGVSVEARYNKVILKIKGDK